MNIYPALKCQMGTWEYYVIKMRMKELAGGEIMFAHDLPKAKRLSLLMQRAINETRVKKDLTPFLAYRDDRFFSSILVASLGGNPHFQGIELSENNNDPLGLVGSMSESFGVLKFDGTQKYYALDGQHRLSAIKRLLDANTDPEAPSGFEHEEMTVIVVINTSEEGDDAFTEKYRRLFTSLNRYAKATDTDTNIIMDEDDLFAITTRRLIEEHPYFEWEGDPLENAKVCVKGKNLKEGQPFITSMQTLYKMTEIFLSNQDNELRWANEKGNVKSTRPSDEDLDMYYQQASNIWKALAASLKDLNLDPIKSRSWDEETCIDQDNEHQNNFLFRPICQEVLAGIVREIISDGAPNESLASMKNALKVLNKVDWSLFSAPWRGLLIEQKPDGEGWRMVAGTDRKERLLLSKDLLRWITKLLDYDKQDLAEIKERWRSFLPMLSREEQNKMWSHVVEMAEEN